MKHAQNLTPFLFTADTWAKIEKGFQDGARVSCGAGIISIRTDAGEDRDVSLSAHLAISPEGEVTVASADGLHWQLRGAQMYPDRFPMTDAEREVLRSLPRASC